MLDEKGHNLKTAICFSCACIFTDNDRGRFVDCPECGFSIGRGRFRKIMQWAYEAVRYGFDYRRSFERARTDQAESIETIHFCLSPPEQILVFAAAAAASGIIGNAAYDLIKAAIKKIINECSNKGMQPRAETIRLLTDQQEFEQFLKYLEEFYRGMSGVDEKIRAHILEEVFADKMSEYSKKALEKYDPFDPEMFKFEVKKVIQKLKNRDVPSNSDFKSLWKVLQITETTSTGGTMTGHKPPVRSAPPRRYPDHPDYSCSNKGVAPAQ